MRGDENGKRAIGKASRPSTGKDRDTSRAGGNYGVSDVTKQETCCLPMYAFIGPDETLRLDTTSNGHSPSTSCSAVQTGGPIKEEKHSSRIESRGQQNIFHSARLFFYTTKQCMGNGSEEKSKKKRGRPARQEGRNKKERRKKGERKEDHYCLMGTPSRAGGGLTLDSCASLSFAAAESLAPSESSALVSCCKKLPSLAGLLP